MSLTHYIIDRGTKRGTESILNYGGNLPVEYMKKENVDSSLLSSDIGGQSVVRGAFSLITYVFIYAGILSSYSRHVEIRRRVKCNKKASDKVAATNRNQRRYTARPPAHQPPTSVRIARPCTSSILYYSRRLPAQYKCNVFNAFETKPSADKANPSNAVT